MDDGLSVQDFCKLIGRETYEIGELANRFSSKNLRGFEKVLEILEDVQNPYVSGRIIRGEYCVTGEQNEAGIYVWDGRGIKGLSSERLVHRIAAEGFKIVGTAHGRWPENTHWVCEDHVIFKSGIIYDVAFIRVTQRLGNIAF
ncbi:MAG: hypothetical protein KKD18_02430 [Nanoarchaeota archaeon]|nr:hypothetical protein [Nanoarchaeota archaeon]MBU0977247.1 hypothetical protein [Nanoarchaeota archaeon]